MPAYEAIVPPPNPSLLLPFPPRIEAGPSVMVTRAIAKSTDGTV
jgi:hypothetical protein